MDGGGCRGTSAAELRDWRFDRQWRRDFLYDELSIVNAMKALRQAVLGKFESAILEYLVPP